MEQWKLERMIKELSAIRGHGTSMISLILPQNEQIAKVNAMLTAEHSTASNIKSRVNRLSVLTAITSTQQRLKLYTKIPPNGLIIYCGDVITTEGKSKKVLIDFEPYKPVQRTFYLCDNKFHTEILQEMLTDGSRYGFIIVDGNETVFGVLSGSVKTILGSPYRPNLPNKHNKGGQSAARFNRLHQEKIQAFIRKVSEMCTKHFIEDNRPNVEKIIIAGSADLKNKLFKDSTFDPRLKAIVLAVVDIQYGGEQGFNQAITLCADDLTNVTYVNEQRVLSEFMTRIATDQPVCYGLDSTMKCIEAGIVNKVLVWKELDVETVIDGKSVNVLEWLAENESIDTCLISDSTPEGAQFCRGFGGIGAFLRYKVDLSVFEDLQDQDLEDLEDFI